MASQRRRPIRAQDRSASGATRSKFYGRGTNRHRREWPVPVRDDQTRSLSLEEPCERVAAGPPPLFAVRAELHDASRDANVFSERPAVALRSNLQFRARRAGTRSNGLLV